MECKVGEGWECIICTDKAPTEDGDDTEVSKILEIGDVLVETPTCHHVFHHSCLYKWIIGNQDNHHRCPMCRTELFNAAADQEYLMAMRFVPDHNDEDMEDDDAEDTDPEDTDDNSDDNSDTNSHAGGENLYDGASEAGTDFEMDIDDDQNEGSDVPDDEMTNYIAQAIREIKDDFNNEDKSQVFIDAQTRVMRIYHSRLDLVPRGMLSTKWRRAIRVATSYGEYLTQSYGQFTDEHKRVGNVWWEMYIAMEVINRNFAEEDWTWCPEKVGLQKHFIGVYKNYRRLREAVGD